jgi:hypothetical protein
MPRPRLGVRAAEPFNRRPSVLLFRSTVSVVLIAAGFVGVLAAWAAPGGQVGQWPTTTADSQRLGTTPPGAAGNPGLSISLSPRIATGGGLRLGSPRPQAGAREGSRRDLAGQGLRATRTAALQLKARASPLALKSAWARLARPVLGLFRLVLRRSRRPDDRHHGVRSAVTSRKFGGSCSGWRGGAGGVSFC